MPYGLGNPVEVSEVRKYWIPRSDVGTYRTLQIMAQIVNESLVDPYVVNKAKQIVAFCPEKNTVCQGRTIFEWARNHTKFIRDPSGVELLHTPKYQLQSIERGSFIQIDCDDFSVLTASLGKAVGMPAKFVILGFIENNAPFTHVYTILKTGKAWMPLDQKGDKPIPRRYITRKEFFSV